MQFNNQHNHEMTEMEFQYRPKVRKVDETTEKEIASHLQLSANRKLVQQTYKQKTGKNILMRDLHNIATSTKIQSSSSGDTRSEVQNIADWLKEEYPAIDCDFIVDTKNMLCGLYIQDSEMKSTFSRFPEVVLADSTYKTNNLNMALYAILSVDGHGESHLICTFFVGGYTVTTFFYFTFFLLASIAR